MKISTKHLKKVSVLAAIVLGIAFIACSSGSDSEGESTAGADSQNAGASGTGGTSGSGGTSGTENTAQSDFVLVEGGTFSMGSENGRDDEKPVHSVTVSPFYICNHEVTQAEWKATMGSNPSEHQGDNLPVEMVSWYAAIAYCNKRSKAEGLDLAYSVEGIDDWGALEYSAVPPHNNAKWNAAVCDFSANGYRLPTEAEWEFAARGGKKSGNFEYSGSGDIGSVAWYQDNCERKTHEVKTKAKNELGLYDMSGNVWEGCWDWIGRYSSESASDPLGASSGLGRVARGGSWWHDASVCRVALRHSNLPDGVYNDLGFRVVRTKID